MDSNRRGAAPSRAVAVRAARAHFLASLDEPRSDWGAVFAAVQADPLLCGMRVADLLAAVPGVGKAGAAKMMTAIGIAPTRQIRNLTRRQLADLLIRLASDDGST